MNRNLFGKVWPLLVVAAATVAGLQAAGQYKMNFGLTSPQPAHTLPQGKAPYSKPVRTGSAPLSSTPVASGNSEYTLHHGWQMAEGLQAMQSFLAENYDAKPWYNATIPGTVLTTLVNEGVYPDPYMGLNNMAIPENLCRTDWWYRLRFEAPAGENGKTPWLCFDGINYKARIWLNGTLLGQMEGAFKRGRFDVSLLLRTNGFNTLVVQVIPPPNPGIPHEQSKLAGMGPNGGQLALDGPTFISSEGWDWVPGIRDRNMGIWQPVKLCYTGDLLLHDPQVITNLPLPDTSKAFITVKAMVENRSSLAQEATISFLLQGSTATQQVSLQAGEKKEVILSPAKNASLTLQQPKLWWPNGYGEQNLYTAKILATDSRGNVSDSKQVRFGIREFSYELMADTSERKPWRFVYSPTDMNSAQPLLDNTKRREFVKSIFIPTLRPGTDKRSFESLPENDNPYLVIRVNGQRIYCRGGNWGMDDGMKRIGRERLEPAFALHRQANFNMIRNWTGESTEPVFYELADEYGMLVWNDFWISTEGYNLNPVNQPLFLENTLDVIKRYRNHASIAIWCPRNEGYAPAGIEDELAAQLAREDGTRHYQGNSREINLRQSGCWHYLPDNAEYFTKYAQGFSTEIGTFSVPTAATMRKFLPQADQWPIGDAWHYHDLHADKQNLEGYLGAVDSLYGKPTDLDDFCKKVQLINYDSHRAMFEAWNSKLWKQSSGVLLWMTHPAWPSMIWQTYSWDFETHGSFFGSKKACQPIHVQMNAHDGKVVALNNLLKNLGETTVEYSVYGLDGKRLGTTLARASLPANSMTEVAVEPPAVTNLPEVYMIRIRMYDDRKNLLAENSYWKSTASATGFQAFNNLANAQLLVKPERPAAGNLSFWIQNKSDVPAIAVKLNLKGADGNDILPAHFSDGYFTLLPGEKRLMQVNWKPGTETISIATEAYNSKMQLHAVGKVPGYADAK